MQVHRDISRSHVSLPLAGMFDSLYTLGSRFCIHIYTVCVDLCGGVRVILSSVCVHTVASELANSPSSSHVSPVNCPPPSLPQDGLRSDQFEHTLLVTETACDILTL